MLRSLSGRFLLLTVIFVMLAEILIFVPSVARFREDYLLARMERAQIAALAVLAGDNMVGDQLSYELLDNAEVLNVVLDRDEVRQLVLSVRQVPPIADTFDLRDPAVWTLIRDALMRLANPRAEVIRVIGLPVHGGGDEIEITLQAAPLRAAMIDYGITILLLSAVISVVTASLLFWAVRRLLVLPIKHVVDQVSAYAENPEDARRIIAPSAGVRELHEAETALQSMQTQLTGALRQKERLAQLGSAVAKISHDLRNILSVTSLLADRFEDSDDPMVRRNAPKLVSALSRAVNLCESTLAFGRAEEAPPQLTQVRLAELVDGVVENERLAAEGTGIGIDTQVPPTLQLRADPDQLFRVLSNLVRNAREAMAGTRSGGRVRVAAAEAEAHWWIEVCDTGPGLPQKAREHLFQPFQGGTRKGGSGLGLAIAADLVRGHDGRLDLVKTGPDGTTFRIILPKGLDG